jgi:hypothetical protein
MKSYICLVISFVALQVVSSSQWFRGRRNRGGNFIRLDNIAESNANALAINAGLFGDANAVANSDATNVNVINQFS